MARRATALQPPWLKWHGCRAWTTAEGLGLQRSRKNQPKRKRNKECCSARIYWIHGDLSVLTVYISGQNQVSTPSHWPVTPQNLHCQKLPSTPGIYNDKDKCIIHFAPEATAVEPPAEGPAQTDGQETDGGEDEPDGIVDDIRKKVQETFKAFRTQCFCWASQAITAGARITKGRPYVQASPVDEFYERQNSDEVWVVRRPQTTSQPSESEQQKKNNKLGAAAIAAFLAKEDTEKRNYVFGDYDLIQWNCEHFATFCRTAMVTEKDLHETRLTKTYFREKGRPTSAQVDILLKGKASKGDKEILAFLDTQLVTPLPQFAQSPSELSTKGFHMHHIDCHLDRLRRSHRSMADYQPT